MNPLKGADPLSGTYNSGSTGGFNPQSIDTMDMYRTLPRQVSTGVMRGTQAIGYGNARIDGSTNSITVGTVTIDGNASSIKIGSTISLNGSSSTISIGNSITLNGMNSQIIVGSTIIIDGTTGTITVTNPADGSKSGMGLIPTTSPPQYGFFTLDSKGNLVTKTVGGTVFFYDVNTKKNTVQVGTLPDGTGGIAAANTTFNVADGF